MNATPFIIAWKEPRLDNPMTRLIFICLTICLFSVFAFSQNQPFEVFENAAQKTGFDGDKENLSAAFNQERIRLGENFERELWKYLGEDVEKYYWISFFLDWKEYLHGNKPLPELALKIRQRGVEIIGDTEDKENLGRKITFLRDLAIASYLSGKRDLAIEYKQQANPIYEKYDYIGAYVGATTKFNYCIYDNLEKDPDICKEEDHLPRERIISSGVLNGKAVRLPQPVYPESLKKISGQVTVKVIVGFDGQIISAKAIKGVAELFEVSVKAAKKARFTPTTLSGKPVKVSGVIVYDFVR